MPASASGTGIHWQVSQATSLTNIVFDLSTVPGNQHQGSLRPSVPCDVFRDLISDESPTGIWMENGRCDSC